jgi:hypothetical protein
LKFKIDENLPSEFARILQGAGFEADTVADENLSGAPDAVLAQHARVNHRVLITLDMDFANIQSYPPVTHAGIVVFRPHSQDNAGLAANSRARSQEILSGRSIVDRRTGSDSF